MKYCFVFCHGFGFSSHYWDPLRPYFKDETCLFLDLGYFGNQDLGTFEDGYHYVGIGHSLGFIKLLNLGVNLGVNFKTLIGLNGFIDFLSSDVDIAKQRNLELSFMKQNIAKDPVKNLGRFYSRCGIVQTIDNTCDINVDILLNDLDVLKEKHTLHEKPTLIIGALNDGVVPEYIVRDNFEHLENVTLKMYANGKHIVGHDNPDAVYKDIMKFL